jgi:signal transduction histidine kinase
MSSQAAARLAWSMVALTVLFTAACAAIQLTNPSSARGLYPQFPGFVEAFSVGVVGAAVGALIASRHPRNPVGWIFCGSGLAVACTAFGLHYSGRALLVAPGSLPAGHEVNWLVVVVQVGWAPLFTFLLLLFPDGRLPSRRWRPVVWATGLVLVALAVVLAVDKGPPGDAVPGRQTATPNRLVPAVLSVLSAALLALILLCAVALLLRLRRATGDERRQLRWFVSAATLLAVGAAINALGILLYGDAQPWGQAAVALAGAAVPVAAGVAIFKYRLYDIDLILNRAIVLSALASFITAGYILVVVGIGSVIGRRGDLGVGLSLAATGMVALAFQPARRRAQRLADRLVYGERATPYQAMAELARQMADALSLEEVLPRIAEAAARGVGASRSHVRLFLPQGQSPWVVWPPDTAELAFDRTITVIHGQEPVGEIAVTMPPGAPLTKAAAGLLGDLAAQAGPAMHNVRLTAELQARLEELTRQSAALEASRQRLITARNQEQRRLERELRAGPQMELSAVGDMLQQAEQAVGRDPERAAALLDDLDQASTRALETLRDLARGVFPRLLADKGVWAALGAHLRKLEGPVRLEGPSAMAAARFAPQVEAAVYFCCVQAVHDAGGRPPHGPVTVRLEAGDGWLGFAVTHQRRGPQPPDPGDSLGSQHMVDRVEALGGTLLVRAVPGGGGRVEGRIPVQPATGIADQPAMAAAQAAASRSGRNLDLGM